jgi:hypothetical protein
MLKNSLLQLSASDLRRAAELRAQIDTLQTEIARILGGHSTVATETVTETGKRKRTMSLAARAKIGAAQKARWAARKGAAMAAPKKGGRRKISAAGRARIAAAQKERWAKLKRANQKGG